MSWQRLRTLIRNLFRRSQIDRDLDNEVRGYVEALTDEHVAAGLSRENAARRARLQAGGIEQVKEHVRDVRTGAWIAQLGQDVRHGIRQLRRAPGFTAIAVSTLGLGIGVSVAIFSIVDTVLFRSLPYAEPERLVSVYEGDRGRSVLAWSEYLAFAERAQSLDIVAAIHPVSVTAIDGAEPEQGSGALVSASLVPLLGVNLVRGRNFDASEDRPGAGQAVLLSEEWWHRVYRGDPEIVGKVITLEVNESWGVPLKRSQLYTVVGILPASFQALLPGLNGDVWLPLAAAANHNHDLFVFGRRRAGVSLADVKRDLEAVTAPMQSAVHSNGRAMQFSVTSVMDDLLGDWRRALLVLLGAVGFVFLIACVNVANLILARGRARSREIAIRAGLGAARGRLVRQLLTESTLLALGGGALALLVAQWSVNLLASLAPPGVPRLDEVSLDARVLGFMVLTVLFAALGSGLVPALRLSHVGVVDSLREGGRLASEGRGSRRLQSVMVVTEVALAIVLLIGSGLMIRTLISLVAIDSGFNARDVFTLRVSLPRHAYQTREQRTRFYEPLFTKLASLPDVSAVAVNHAPPFGGLATGTRVAENGTTQWVDARWQMVSDGYFRALGIPIQQGTTFTAAELADTMRSAVIDRLLADRLWPGRDPIGRHLVMIGNDKTPLSIVGVAGSVREADLTQPSNPTVYLPAFPRTGTIFLRTSADPAALVPAIRRAFSEIDRVVAPTDFQLMETRVSRSFSLQRYTALLLGVFASVAAFLGLVGLYGVISFSVGQRTKEIGIRSAMGARWIEVVGLVLGQGARLVAAGVAIGVVAAFGLTRLLEALLFDVTATDAATFAAAAAVMMLTALLACLVPARRAARLDPVAALRQE